MTKHGIFAIAVLAAFTFLMTSVSGTLNAKNLPSSKHYTVQTQDNDSTSAKGTMKSHEKGEMRDQDKTGTKYDEKTGTTRRGKSMSNVNLIDINTATVDELKTLPGIGDVTAKKIVDNRPYNTKKDLTTKKVVTKSEYKKISHKIIAKKTTENPGNEK